MNNFKELGKFSNQLQLENYMRVYSIRNLPRKDLSENNREIIFVGKSNVGKSTLINTLLNHKIAKTSKIPGCTRWIGYLKLKNVTLIDLPGYGFASVSKGRQEFWSKMIGEYIKAKRANLAFILIDSRKGIQEIDIQIAQILNTNVHYIYTKYDKFEEKNMADSGFELPENTMAVSVKSGLGIDQLREILCGAQL